MSTISYTNNNNNNQVPLQQQPPPLRQQQQQQGRRRSGVLGGNDYIYQNYGNYPIYPNQYPNGNFYRSRNTFYNRNYQPQRRFNGYRIMNQPYIPPLQQIPQRRFYRQPTMQRLNLNQGRIGRTTRPRSSSNQNQRRSQSRQPQQRRRRPRQLRLNDFMPTELRDPSPMAPNLPQEFNLETIPAPPGALPQRQVFANAATTANNNNTTQPFMVNQDNNQQQATTTSSYRRQQRRAGQQQNRQNRRKRRNSNYNRFAELAEDNDDNNDDPVETDLNDEPIFKNKNKNRRDMKKKKTRLYLESNRMLRWFEDNSKNSKNSASGRGNQAYILASAPIYDEWVRNNYELQVWQTYLKMGTEQKHWAKEVVQRTKKRDETTNSRFINKKINQIMANIAQASATVSKLQMELNTYWMQNSSEIITQKQAQTTAELTTNLVLERTGLGSTLSKNTVPASTITTTTTAGSTTIKGVYRDPVDRLEKHILDYIHHCTQHAKKIAETRIQLAKAQMDEFKALEDFEQIATPSQWNIHLMLKPKVKLCSTKAKNYVLATKRAEYDLPPKFISKIDFTFKIDESIVNKDEIQATYDEMRQITKDFRTQAMKLYVQSLAREHELLSNEIKRIIEGFPKKGKKKIGDDDSNAEASAEASFDAEADFDTEAGFAAFKQYHQLRQQRFDLEVNQSCYFLDEQRVENEQNNPELVAVPTLIRSLGEDFLLQP
ncbi:unnamed protein product [Rotaria socialis]